ARIIVFDGKHPAGSRHHIENGKVISGDNFAWSVFLDLANPNTDDDVPMRGDFRKRTGLITNVLVIRIGERIQAVVVVPEAIKPNDGSIVITERGSEQKRGG